MKRKWLVVFLIIIIAISASITSLLNKPWSPSLEQKGAAADYLAGHFNESVGLIYESEDNGTRFTVNGTSYRCNQTYNIYSDNLLAEWALMPYRPIMSQNINQKIQNYSLPPSDYFEVLFGNTISEPLCNSRTINITFDENKIILAEFRNYSDPINGQYADAMIYQSLNSYLKGNLPEAKTNFSQALSLWDGKGINDDATKNEGKYSNYKLALLVFASEVLNMPIDLAIGQKLWSMQQENGGITSCVDLDGVPGSTNAETTSMTLLAYNTPLISEMQALYGKSA